MTEQYKFGLKHKCPFGKHGKHAMHEMKEGVYGEYEEEIKEQAQKNPMPKHVKDVSLWTLHGPKK